MNNHHAKYLGKVISFKSYYCPHTCTHARTHTHTHNWSSALPGPLKWSVKELEELSSIEDRGQTDRVTALPRPYAQDIDLWSWPMTLIFKARWAMVMTPSQTQVQSSVVS